MSHSAQYDEAFVRAFAVTAERLPGLAYQAITAWDSIGHMNLMGELEQAFGIELDIDDIVDFSSYEKGKEILRKYGIAP
jgi:hypothetical protein